jgi:transcriptional regulator with XRE-family HTH domain
METFGQRLKRMREAAGLSQSDLWRAVRDKGGPSQGYISALERGERDRPGLEVVRLLAQAIGCKPAVLAGFEDSEKISESV